MEVVKRIGGWLGLTPAARPEVAAMREALEEGRHAKLAEDYERALQALGRALDLAKRAQEPAAIAVIALHQAEVLIRQGAWGQAEQILKDILRRAQASDETVQASYTLSVLGTLAQAQGDWAGARRYYEQALAQGRGVKSAGAEGRALGHLADTYLNEGNASYAAHLLRDSLPKLNSSGDIELSSYFVGRMGEALIDSGQEAEGQHLLSRALQLAEHMHYRTYERQWALALGKRALSEARYADAQAMFARALRLFPDHAESPDYVQALCQMSRACLSLRDHMQALDYAQKAVAASETQTDELRATAAVTMGMALRAAGRSPDAIAPLETAAAIYEALEAGDVRRQRVETLRNLAAAQADAGDARAETTYQRAIHEAERLGADLELAQLRRDMGLMYSTRGQKQAAIQAWMEALTICEEKRHYAQAARLYTDIGNARKSMGQTQRAMKDYEQALMTLNSVDEGDLETRGLVLGNAATAYAEQGDVDSADAFFNDSISIAEKMGDATAECTRRGNYGYFLLTVGRPRRAIATLEQALQTSRSLNLNLQAAVQTDNLGLAYDALADYSPALGYHRQALEMMRQLGSAHWCDVISVNLANTLLSLGERDEAQALLETALAGGRTRDDAEVVIRALTGLARAALLRGQAGTVDGSLDEAIRLARRADQRRLLAETLSVRSEQLAAVNRHEEAAAAWDEAQKLFNILRMPQAKMQPAWLGNTRSAED